MRLSYVLGVAYDEIYTGNKYNTSFWALRFFFKNLLGLVNLYKLKQNIMCFIKKLFKINIFQIKKKRMIIFFKKLKIWINC
mgnify:CR=1 FL=1